MLQRKLYRITDEIKRHFCEYSSYYICLIFFAVLGICMGFYRGTAIKSYITIDIIKIGYISNFIRGSTTASSFFFWHLLLSLTLIVAVFAVNIVIYTIPLTAVIMFYRGYLLGLNLFILTILLGSGTAILLWIIIFPIELAIFFFLISSSCVCIRRCINGHRFGYAEGSIFWLMNKIWLHLTALFLICFLEYLALQFFNSSFILIL